MCFGVDRFYSLRLLLPLPLPPLLSLFFFIIVIDIDKDQLRFIFFGTFLATPEPTAYFISLLQYFVRVRAVRACVGGWLIDWASERGTVRMVSVCVCVYLLFYDRHSPRRRQIDS